MRTLTEKWECMPWRSNFSRVVLECVGMYIFQKRSEGMRGGFAHNVTECMISIKINKEFMECLYRTYQNVTERIRPESITPSDA